jgi:uncharacterized membrane protein YccC
MVQIVHSELHRPRDPGSIALRRAARVALVMPLVFAYARFAIGNAQVTMFVAFGTIAMLIMADFGGTRSGRAGAYAGATLLGVPLVALGTLISPHAWAAALVMFLVGFCVQFVGVFGSYAAAAQTALLLSFVLAVSVPAPPTEIGARLFGWCLAGGVSTLAGVFLWPRFERSSLRHQAATACRAVAALIVALCDRHARQDLTQRRQAAQAAVGAVRTSYNATPKRPAGPARRDRAFVVLLAELERTLALITGPLAQDLTTRHPDIDAGHDLAGAVVRTLEASAEVLTGGSAPNLIGLQETRIAHRRALDRWAGAALRAGSSPEMILEGLEADEALRIVSNRTLALGSNAVIASGRSVSGALPLPAETPRRDGMAGMAIRVVHTIRTHLSPRSSVLHHSLRAGIGLALAVLLARLMRLDHAFWVVFGTLSVLRSSALDTERSTVQALVGTGIGFVIGGLFMLVAGASSPILWVALPIGVFLAGYASGAVGFVAGQAAFTLTVIILFNLISPVGWKLGLVRIEDVAIGAAVSVLVGLLLWPRGARAELRRAVAELYRAVAVLLACAFNHILELDAREHVELARHLAVRAHDRAGEALDQYLRERSARPLDQKIAASLVSSGGHAIVAGDQINHLADRGYQVYSHEDSAALQVQAHALVAAFLKLAAQLDRGTPTLEQPGRVSDTALRDAALHALRRWKEDPAEGRAAIAVVGAAEWIHLLDTLAADLEEPVDDIAAIA